MAQANVGSAGLSAAAPNVGPSGALWALGWPLLGLVVFAYYLGLSSDFSYDAWPATSGGFIFNQQLNSLLHLRLDIEPRVLGNEAFVRQGRSYTYFGIWPALVRLPVLTQLWRDWTAVYCSIAGSLAAMFLLKSIRDIAPSTPFGWQRVLLLVAAASLIMSGPQIELLGKPSVYVEAILWGYAACCAFLCASLPILLGHPPTPARLSALATLAAAGLLARVSTGLALYVACGALFAVLLYFESPASSSRRIRLASLLLPAMLLAAGIGISLTVNALRWGNPLEFAPLSSNRFYAADPARLARIERLGAFNLARVPDALSYYAAPGWFFAARPGDARFERVADYFDGPEGPPIGLAQTQSLWLGLAAVGLVALRRPGVLGMRAWPIAGLAVGLAIAPLLIASYHYLAFRYRTEFAPLVLLLALCGLRVLLLPRATVGRSARACLLALICAGALWQITQAHLASRVHACTPFGSHAAGIAATARCLAADRAASADGFNGERARRLPSH